MRAAIALMIVLLLVPSMASAARAPLHVKGNRLVAGGRTVQLRGVNRSGTEYACIQGWGLTDSPQPTKVDGRALIAGIKSWDANVVRVPLNEDCWLGINTGSQFAGKTYRAAIRRYVAALHRAGLDAILDLHVAAPSTTQSTAIDPMPDADHAPAFWESLARAFRRDHRVLFDLYNEPHDVDWACWRDGCDVNGYRAAGLQQLVNAVRSTGATQPLLLGGLGYSGDPSGWLAHLPHDPRHALVLSLHTYGGFAECSAACHAQVLKIHRHHPVVIGELGENDCAHGYIDAFMDWADAHGIGYLGWAWDATSGGSWNCNSGPALITDYDGTPTAFGIGLRDHLRARARWAAGHGRVRARGRRAGRDG